MTIAESYASELQQEAVATRKVLERVPDDRLSWKPHAKSMSFIELASHVATILEWGQVTIENDQFVMDEDYKPWRAGSSRELVERFEQGLAAAMEALQGRSDDEWAKPWSLKKGDAVLFTMPKSAIMRAFVLNHLVHHRGQLSVYLRLNDIPVPAIYGPSADES